MMQRCGRPKETISEIATGRNRHGKEGPTLTNTYKKPAFLIATYNNMAKGGCANSAQKRIQQVDARPKNAST